MSRDLSGFAKRTIDVAPPPPPPPAPAAPAQANQESKRRPGPKARKGAADRQPRRIKVGVSLPAALHARLRGATEERSCFKADVVLDALDEFAERLRREHKEKASGGRRRSGRRRRVVDGTACELYVTEDERQELDQLAADVGESRSALVTRLLELALGSEDQS